MGEQNGLEGTKIHRWELLPPQVVISRWNLPPESSLTPRFTPPGASLPISCLPFVPPHCPRLSTPVLPASSVCQALSQVPRGRFGRRFRGNCWKNIWTLQGCCEDGMMPCDEWAHSRNSTQSQSFVPVHYEVSLSTNNNKQIKLCARHLSHLPMCDLGLSEPQFLYL